MRGKQRRAEKAFPDKGIPLKQLLLFQCLDLLAHKPCSAHGEPDQR